MAALFNGFADYDRSYDPDPWRTDGSHHTICLMYEGNADTVQVYEPDRAEIPGRLRQIIRQLDILWQSTLYPED